MPDDYWKRVALECQQDPKHIDRVVVILRCPSCEETFAKDRAYAFIPAYHGRIYFCSTQCKLRWRTAEMTEADEYIGETLDRGFQLTVDDEPASPWRWVDWT